ncbi:2924_t:CDS:2 [Paraglomus brasilianum]|uniref:2924_t:CDS:1 n=1 Tax=Paraglomus brasilianum TaxID=144538 RepID=A0A9N8Z5N5_9GLOM|nr:2924_t:CDS:2 [Paraglomus brasilianum]
MNAMAQNLIRLTPRTSVVLSSLRLLRSYSTSCMVAFSVIYGTRKALVGVLRPTKMDQQQEKSSLFQDATALARL